MARLSLLSNEIVFFECCTGVNYRNLLVFNKKRAFISKINKLIEYVLPEKETKLLSFSSRLIILHVCLKSCSSKSLE